MASSSNFDLTYNKLDVVAGGALSNATSTPVSGGSGGSGVTQIVAGTNVTISPSGGTGVVTVNSTAGGGGTVTSVASGTGLTGGPITTSGTLSIASTGVSAASYGTASSVPTIAVNAQGQITSASNTSIAISGGAVSGNIAGNAANVTGIVAIGNGGTGATTAATARTNLGAGTVTSVATSGSVNGITLTGGPITTSGTVTLGGTLGSIANSQLSNSAITINTSTGLSGGGTVSLGGSLTLTNTVSGLPSGATQGQVLLQGASTAGWYNQSYNVTAFASLSAAITAAGSTGVLYFPTAYTIPSGTTISNPIIVEGLLTCSGAATFNGTIQAPLQKIFTGGTVAIGQATPYIYPEWFGALKNGTSDDQPAIVAALAAVTYDSNNSAPIQSIVLTGGYYIGSNISVAHGQIFKVNGNSDFYAYGSAITTATDCLTFTGGTNITDVPSINGFVKGAGIVLYAVNFINIKCFKITFCLYGVKTYAFGGPTPPAAHSCNTNIVTINQISDCKYGFFFTDDGLSSVIQGSEYYCNFYTNNNLASPWLVGSISNGIAACMWDSGNVNPSNWNGNLIDIKSIDINGASNSYGFYSPSNTYFVIEWVINSFLWFGGINSTNSSTAAYIYGYYQSCTMSFDIQIDQSSPWSVFNVKGDNNRIISLAGGGAVSYPSNSNYPGNPLNLSSTSITNSSFLPYPYTNNKMFLVYGGPYAGVTSSIPANGLLTLYAYHPFADGYSNHKVQSVFVRGGGSGYSSPVVSFSGGGGSGASANATLGSGGSIASITMTSGGSSYTSPPTVTVSGGSGSGASLQGILNGGSSNNIQVTVLNSIGLVFESAYDNSANNSNEIVLNFRNVSGSTIASNTQINMVMSVGL